MTSQNDGAPTDGAPQYEGHVDLVADGVLIGWARRVDSDEPVSVSIYSRGRLVGAGTAALYRADLLAAGKGNGWHAFRVPLPPGVPLDGLRVDADQIFTLPLSQSLRSAMSDTAVVSAPAATPAAAPATGPVVWLDLSDFLFYLRHHKTVSGIQRVQCEIVRALLAGSDLNSRFCITSPEAREYYEMPGPVLASLLDHLDTNNAVPEAEWIAYVRMIADTDRLRPAHIVRGDMLFVLGAFWCLPESVYLIAGLRSRGVHVGVYIYDLIPLNNPEYCDGGLVDIFVSSFALIAQITDLIFTISAFTAQEVAAYYKAIGLPPKTIKPILLAHEMHPGGKTAQQLADDGANQRLEAIGGPYVLCVCTIEIRKNHVYLLRIWRELLKRYPRGQVPKLVLVGRRGWRVDDFFGQLAASRNLDGHVHVLHDLDDADLQILYKNCLFTVFPTLCEGWGLPVGESLTYGKLCVASHATSVPEVGHEFCTYIDPDNVHDGYRTIERLIFDKEERTALETAIRTRFQPRSWNMVTAKFVAEIVDYWRKAPAVLAPVVVAGRGELVRLQRKGQILSTEAVARERPDYQLICAEGWHNPEVWGTWARGRTSRLDLLLDLATPPLGSGRVRVYLLLLRPPGLAGKVLTVSAPCGAVRKLNIDTRTKYLTSLECTPLPAAAGFGGLSLTLLLDSDGAKQEDGRLLGIGISALVVVDADDIGQRLEALESLVTLD